MKTLVVALGGNALCSAEKRWRQNQYRNIADAVYAGATLVSAGDGTWQRPRVGLLALQNLARKAVEPYPRWMCW